MVIGRSLIDIGYLEHLDQGICIDPAELGEHAVYLYSIQSHVGRISSILLDEIDTEPGGGLLLQGVYSSPAWRSCVSYARSGIIVGQNSDPFCKDKKMNHFKVLKYKLLRGAFIFGSLENKLVCRLKAVKG